MATKRTKKSAPTLGPKGRPLTKIRLVLDGKGGLLPFLASLTPSQRERTTEANVNSLAGTFRIVLELPSSETRDIDEAIRALPGAAQALVVHASKLPA